MRRRTRARAARRQKEKKERESADGDGGERRTRVDDGRAISTLWKSPRAKQCDKSLHSRTAHQVMPAEPSQN